MALARAEGGAEVAGFDDGLGGADLSDVAEVQPVIASRVTGGAVEPTTLNIATILGLVRRVCVPAMAAHLPGDAFAPIRATDADSVTGGIGIGLSVNT